MDYSNTIERILAGDIPPLETVTSQELSALVTLLQAFHLGRAMGQEGTPEEAKFDLFKQLVFLNETLSDITRRAAVKDALLASWPKTKEVISIPLNSLSIAPTELKETT